MWIVKVVALTTYGTVPGYHHHDYDDHDDIKINNCKHFHLSSSSGHCPNLNQLLYLFQVNSAVDNEVS